MATRTIYEQHLPPENDPEVVRLASEWITTARAAQRPWRAAAYAIPSLLIGVVLWGALTRWLGFDMPWFMMAGSAIALGVALGRPCRDLGALFDRRWAVLIGAVGLAMGVLGDLHAVTSIIASRDGAPWSDVVSTLDARAIREWLTARQPLDWLVAGLGAAGAGLAARPTLDARQLVMEARIVIHQQDLAAREAAERAANHALVGD